jgi:hypothetical protein
VRRLRSLLPLCVVLSLAAACTTGFVYNRLETITYWYFRNQVSLDDGQATALRESLREFYAWHRVTELPRYAEFLDTLASESAAGPLSRAQVDEARVEIESLWRALIAGATPYAARTLASLTPAQRDELFESFAEDDEDLREEYCLEEPAKQRRRREKSFVKNIESWTGRLSAEQRELVDAGVARLAPDSCDWVDSVVASRAAFRALIDSYSNEPDFDERLARFLSNPEDHWTEAYRREFEANRDVIVETLVSVDVTLTGKQRSRASTRLEELAGDLRRLSGAAPVTQVSSR